MLRDKKVEAAGKEARQSAAVRYLMIVLGYDPGGGGRSGDRKSGVAMLDASNGEAVIKIAQCESVAEALYWFDAPAAAGYRSRSA